MNLHTPEQLLKLSQSEKNAQKKLRLLALSHFVDGYNRAQIARMLKVSRCSVNKWVSAYLNEGLSGLESKKQSGREAYLTRKQKEQLSKYITDYAQSDQGGRLTGVSIVQYIKAKFNIDYHPNAIYKLLRSLGFSWITSRSRHPKQNEEIQAEFKKTKD